MRRLIAEITDDRRILFLVAVQGITGLVAVGALIYVLLLGPRVQRVERHVVEIQRVVREIVRKEVVPGKKEKPPPPGRPGPGPSARSGPNHKGVRPTGKLPEVGLLGPAR